jgi:hypothetical protein
MFAMIVPVTSEAQVEPEGCGLAPRIYAGL